MFRTYSATIASSTCERFDDFLTSDVTIRRWARRRNGTSRILEEKRWMKQVVKRARRNLFPPQILRTYPWTFVGRFRVQRNSRINNARRTTFERAKWATTIVRPASIYACTSTRRDVDDDGRDGTALRRAASRDERCKRALNSPRCILRRYAFPRARGKHTGEDTDISLSFGSTAPRDCMPPPLPLPSPPSSSSSSSSSSPAALRDLHPQVRSCGCGPRLPWIFSTDSCRAFDALARHTIIEWLSAVGA